MVYHSRMLQQLENCWLLIGAYASGEFVDLYWDNMVKDNIKELDVYVEELERKLYL